jgi:hypothetical protein
MKKLIFTVLINMFFMSLCFGQSDTTYLAQLNDSTYQKVTINYDDLGREISTQKIYYDSLSFYNFIFDLVVTQDKLFTRSEKKLIAAEKAEKKAKKEFKEMQDFYLSFTGNTYKSFLDSILKSQLVDTFRLITVDTVYNVTLTSNQNKFKDIGLDKKMRVTYFQVGKIEIKTTADDPFFVGDAILLEEKDNQGRKMYRGKLDDGTKIILRR